MRVRAAASLLSFGFLLAACAQKPAPAPVVAVAPDPFGYLKLSAVCTVSPLHTDAAGNSASMSVRSDDGLCTVPVAQPNGTAYASFLLQTPPAHGKTFIHNYNNQTLVSYTATTAYAGPDSFVVSLIPSDNGQRTLLRVSAAVDATGVPVPPPPVVAVPAPSAGMHKSSTRKSTAHQPKKKKKTSSGS